jgi:hypothetical protein
MTDCCSSENFPSRNPNKRCCPVSGEECAEVPAKTIAYHIRDSWKWLAKAEHYFFCADPDCDVVYFGDDGTIFRQSQLRTRIGLKNKADDLLVCYCFGVTRAEALSDSSIRDYVVKQTKNKLCSCDTCNPSGRCCLKDFPLQGKAA